MRTAPEGAAVEMNSAARRRRHAALRYGRLVMWLVSGALLVAFASYVALPLGLTWYIPQLAARHGVHLQVERARVEPFRSTIRLYGVGVATSGQSSTRWSSVAARVDLSALLSGRLVLDDFHLSEARLHVGEPIVGMDGTLPEVSAALPGDVSIGELVIDGVELGAVSEAAGTRGRDRLAASRVAGPGVAARGGGGRSEPVRRGRARQAPRTDQSRRIGLDSQWRGQCARSAVRRAPGPPRRGWIVARTTRRSGSGAGRLFAEQRRVQHHDPGPVGDRRAGARAGTRADRPLGGTGGLERNRVPDVLRGCRGRAQRRRGSRAARTSHRDRRDVRPGGDGAGAARRRVAHPRDPSDGGRSHPRTSRQRHGRRVRSGRRRGRKPSLADRADVRRCRRG